MSAWLEGVMVKKVSFSMAGKGRGHKVNVSLARRGHGKKSKFMHGW
jgi:hypothetical protein